MCITWLTWQVYEVLLLRHYCYTTVVSSELTSTAGIHDYRMPIRMHSKLTAHHSRRRLTNEKDPLFRKLARSRHQPFLP